MALAAALFSVGPLSAAESAPIKVGLKLVAGGLTSPLTYAPLPDGRALVVDQVGLVRLLDAQGTMAADPVFDIRSRLSPVNNGAFDERGLLDLVLHPKFAENRRIYVTYTAPKSVSTPADWDCVLRLSEFKLREGGGLAIDGASERILLEIAKPFNNHNGARLVFGPDGFLYMSVGDGGNANDEGKRPSTGNSQNTWVFLGKMLRLDVDSAKDGKLYSIPSDNPFVDGKEGLPEIFAYGLRNCWGISFDKGGKDFFAADVGQDLYEEVNLIVKGGNYGWNKREAYHPFDPKTPKNTPEPGAQKGARGEPFIDPILEYPHPSVRKGAPAYGTSITGGFVYRGSALPALAGQYIFADWSQNWGLPQGVLLLGRRPESGTRWTVEPIQVSNTEKFRAYITGMGQDNTGELYVLTNGSNSLIPGKGQIWKIVPAQ
jgi:glucose/arabinose dehydrogenase